MMIGKLVQHRFFPMLILVFLACVSYANALHAPFVFDDFASVQSNHTVRFFSFNVKQLLVTRSLLYPTYAFNEWLGGQDVFGYHILDLILHVLNGLLVFAIAKRIFEKIESDAGFPARTYALLSAAFFLVHPVQTEAVTYISERPELLSKLVYLCGLLFFMWLPERRIGFFLSIPVLCFLAIGLAFKETAITLPASIFLYDYVCLAKCKIKNVLSRWPFYGGLAIFGGVAAYLSRDVLRRPLIDLGKSFTPHDYLLTEFRVIARYLRLIVFPSGLNLDYDFPIARSIREPAVALSLFLILGLVVAAWRLRARKPIVTFSIFWFFITLAPTSTVIPIPDPIFEHRLYLPLAGICLLFPLAVNWVANLGSNIVNTRRTVGFACFILGILTVATILRNNVWSDDVRLFSDVVAKSPHKWRAYNHLVFSYMGRGEEEQAISVAKLGLQNVPEYRISFLDTIGNLYLKLGRSADAAEYFKQSNDEAVRLGEPSSFIATSYNNLGVAYLSLAKSLDRRQVEGRTQALRRAREAFQKGLDKWPTNMSIVDSLVNVTYDLGEGPALESESRAKLAANPNQFTSLYMLATLLSLQDRYRESIEYFRQAEQVEKQSEMLYFNYAFALSKAGQADPAIEEYMKALQIDPIFHEANYNLALLYLQKADYSSAVQRLNAIVSVEAANVRANLKLAEIYADQGKLPLARQHLQQVLKTNPADREALSLFAKIGG